MPKEAEHSSVTGTKKQRKQIQKEVEVPANLLPYHINCHQVEESDWDMTYSSDGTVNQEAMLLINIAPHLYKMVKMLFLVTT
ncbi:hypothetical protein DPMN_054098 [Dreissena polymorpha]|uniref:Uncharacterized protein n=1 Tax=Dreissena polymorpha TaxID=45954 RepID=A0A9D4CQ28_DREPO|nr:hypothetical protein DPMN_054098 [Dreissena polymorpha]